MLYIHLAFQKTIYLIVYFVHTEQIKLLPKNKTTTRGVSSARTASL